MNFLAFDLGGSGGKLYLGSYTGDSLTLTDIHAFQNQPISMGDCLYWDFLHIYQELKVGIKKAIEYTNDQIDFIGFDSFCNDFGLIDENGCLLAPIRCYRDPRTARCQEHTYSILSPESLYQINGNQNALFNTLLQLDAMECEGQGFLLDHAYKALFISDLLIFLLTHRTVTEYTTASVSQMFDFYSGSWSETILTKYKIRKSLFAPIVPPGTIVGSTSWDFNEEVKTKGFAVSTVCQHDTASAFLGSACPAHSAVISCGTWSLVGTETAGPVITEQGFLWNIANEGGFPGHHRLLRNVMGTWIIQEIRRQLALSGQEYTYEELDQAAAASSCPHCFIDPDDEIFYHPGHMIDKIHTFCQEHYSTQPQNTGELINCVYASLAFKYRLAIENLETLTEDSLDTICMVGGGSKSRLMCQTTADICRRRLLAGPSDAAALGNILVQMLAAGAISSVEQGRELIRRCCPQITYQPAGSAAWEPLYHEYLELFFPVAQN